MKSVKEGDRGKGKKPYLKPDEAVLGGCKTSSAAGPARVTCDAGVGVCRALGTS